MLKFLIFAVIMLILWLITKHYVRKKLGLVREFPYKYVNKTHKIVAIIFIFLSIIVYVLVAIKLEWYFYYYHYLYYLFTMSPVLQLFHLFMEWRYKKETKRYILSLVDLFYIVVILVGLPIFLPL